MEAVDRDNEDGKNRNIAECLALRERSSEAAIANTSRADQIPVCPSGRSRQMLHSTWRLTRSLAERNGTLLRWYLTLCDGSVRWESVSCDRGDQHVR